MKINFAVLFSFLLFIIKSLLSNAQFNYFKTMETDFTLLNSTFSTVVISESKDIGACSCDLTPESCDYQCCCDQDCPTSITSIWINNQKNVCLDKSKN